MESWVIQIITGIASAAVGAGASYLKLHQRLVLLRVQSRQQIEQRDAELEALKKERRIRNTRQAERLEQNKELTDLAIRHKEHGLTLQDLDAYGDFVLRGKRVRKAEPSEAQNPEKLAVEIITTDKGERRRVWTDKETGQQLWEYAMRTEEEVVRKRDQMRQWHDWCKVGMDFRSGEEKKAKGLPLTPDEKVAAITLFPQDTANKLKGLPEVSSRLGLDFIVAKFEALAWVTGWEFGWPERESGNATIA